MLIKNPNGWSCLPCCFAMATDTTLKDITDFLGHDGSEVWFPEIQEPYCRRGFHTSEMFDYCLHIDYSAMMMPVLVRLKRQGADYHHDLYEDNGVRFANLIKHPCIILEPSHAVYWDGNKVYDPKDIPRDISGLKPTHVIRVKPVWY